MKLENKTDDEIESWARKFEEADLTTDVRYRTLVRERAKRRQSKQKLSFDKSLAHLKVCAVAQKFTSYGQLAAASGVEWGHARHQMNGAYGHLDTLLDICHHSENLPLLTAICVNQQNLETGKLGEDALSGFVDGARRLGIPVEDADSFHERCVRECFDWGKRQRE